ncbi:MAG: tannase/feruloyl esterase family alpha/beta hydrolase [Burkholderiaceae bacterium]
MAEHCLVKGEMYCRTSTMDGNSYAVGFEMRLPKAWNYASFPFDTGHNAADSSFWEFFVSTVIDPGVTALIWSTPPADPATLNPTSFALNTPIDSMIAAVRATNTTFAESGLDLMQPVIATQLGKLKSRGAKVMVYHGVSDPIFSVNDTEAWFKGVQADNCGDASSFSRFYRVPGMSHCGLGPSTDQFEMLQSLVSWVGKCEASLQPASWRRSGARAPAGHGH